MMVLTVGVYHGIARVYNARRNLSNRGLLPYQAVSGLTIICISSMRIASENPPQSNFELKDDLLFLAICFLMRSTPPFLYLPVSVAEVLTNILRYQNAVSRHLLLPHLCRVLFGY
jgi:hypothetical protein